MKKERKFSYYLFKYAWIVIFVSLLSWSRESRAFDYDDNIGFMKEVPPNLKEAYPVCDSFLDVKWNKPNPAPTGLRILWTGKTRIDMYEADIKQRRALWILLSGKGESLSQSTYVLELEKYGELEKDDPSRQFVRGGEDDNLGGWLGVKTIGSTEKPRWISKKRIENQYVHLKWELYPHNYTFAHFSKNVCLVSPTGDQGWLLEPTKPFVSEKIMSADDKARFEELLRLYARECPVMLAETIAKTHGATTPEPCAVKDLILWSLRYGYQRDLDGDGKMDYEFYIPYPNIPPFICFIHDQKPLLMLYPKECNNHSVNNMGNHSVKIQTVNLFKEDQQCVANAKSKMLKNQ